MKVGALSGRVYPDRKPRRIGGKDASEVERAPAMKRLRAQAKQRRTLSWRFQCYCGSIDAILWRRSWWCPGCGRERLGVE